MLRAIVLYLLGLLQESLDPELKERVRIARNQATALEAERKQLLQDIEDGEKINNQLNTIRTANAIERKKLEESIKQANTHLAAKQKELDALPDHDKLRLPL